MAPFLLSAMEKKRIDEIIIVEGRDDTAAILRGVEAVTIETHGYGIRPSTWDVIDKAYQSKGIIIFTDPDTAGEQIRRRLAERYPDAAHAFLDRGLAEKDGDIGIENASPESIRDALEKARRPEQHSASSEQFTRDDLFRWGLDGVPGAAHRRHEVGNRLGIGMATGKTFLRRLNSFGISREEIEQSISDLD